MPEYFCECCNYKTNRKSGYDDHIKTKKHLSNKSNEKVENPSIESEKLKKILYENVVLLIKKNNEIIDLKREIEIKNKTIDMLARQIQPKIIPLKLN
jgi:hypothetical protein